MLRMKKNRWFKKFESMTIAKRITIMYGGIFSLSLLVISFFIFGISSMVNQNITKQELIKTASNIEDYIKSGNILTQDKISSLLENKYVEVMIFNSENKEVIKSSVGNPPPFLVKPDNREGEGKNGFKTNNSEKVISRNGREYSIEGDKGKEFMLVDKNFEFNGQRFMIQSYKMIGDNQYYLKWFGIRLLIIDIVGILGAFLAGKYISGIILRPVENIRQAAEMISIADLSQRIDVSGPDDEMKELTVTFNSMIERLEASFKKQNQFVSDASHELRTPISVIQGYASLINRWGKSDPSVLQESIDSIIAETDHMGTLIKKLLFLAKSDRSSNHVQKAEMLLNDSVKEIIKEIEVMEINRNINYEEMGEVKIFADCDLIKQLLWIHTENCIKYTKDGGDITFKVYSDDSFAYVSVEDDGAGIKEDDLPYIFDRFYRADKSRNKEIPGTGLGLSIAAWIVKSHDGEIDVESEVGKGTRFINRFNRV